MLKCTDCLHPEGLPSIKTESVDCFLADLPYGVTQNTWDTIIPLDHLWTEILRITKPKSAILFFTKQPFTTLIINSNPNLFRYDLIWEKEKGTKFFEANDRPLPSHENILVFCKNGSPQYYPQKVPGKAYVKPTGDGHKSSNYGSDAFDDYSTVNSGDRYPTTVLKFARDHANQGIHPTQKPVALYEWLLRSYTKPNDLVVDPTFGSGASALACLRLHRQYFGCEINAEYYHLAHQRLQRFVRDGVDSFKKPEKKINGQMTLI